MTLEMCADPDNCDYNVLLEDVLPDAAAIRHHMTGAGLLVMAERSGGYLLDPELLESVVVGLDGNFEIGEPTPLDVAEGFLWQDGRTVVVGFVEDGVLVVLASVDRVVTLDVVEALVD